jgi:hypothetical protein
LSCQLSLAALGQVKGVTHDITTMLRHAQLVLREAAEGHCQNRSNTPCCHHTHENFGTKQVFSLAAQPFEKQAYRDFGGTVASQK